jgi:hypothetical protein
MAKILMMSERRVIGTTPIFVMRDQILPNQGSFAQCAGAAERGSISGACSAIAISADRGPGRVLPDDQAAAASH